MILMSKKYDSVGAFLSLFVPSLFAAGYMLSTDPLLSRVLFVLARAFLLGFPIFWTLAVDRGPFPLPRLKSRGMGAGLIAGIVVAALGLMLYDLVFNDLLAVEGVQQTAALLGWSRNLYPAYSVFIILFNASLEEYYWRWFGFSKLKGIVPREWAYMLSALGFTLHHIIILTIYFGWLYASAFGLCVFVGGLLFAFLYDRYTNIWSPWVCHAVIDAGIMVIGYDMIFS